MLASWLTLSIWCVKSCGFSIDSVVKCCQSILVFWGLLILIGLMAKWHVNELMHVQSSFPATAGDKTFKLWNLWNFKVPVLWHCPCLRNWNPFKPHHFCSSHGWAEVLWSLLVSSRPVAFDTMVCFLWLGRFFWIFLAHWFLPFCLVREHFRQLSVWLWCLALRICIWEELPSAAFFLRNYLLDTTWNCTLQRPNRQKCEQLRVQRNCCSCTNYGRKFTTLDWCPLNMKTILRDLAYQEQRERKEEEFRRKRDEVWCFQNWLVDMSADLLIGDYAKYTRVAKQTIFSGEEMREERRLARELREIEDGSFGSHGIVMLEN